METQNFDFVAVREIFGDVPDKHPRLSRVLFDRAEKRARVDQVDEFFPAGPTGWWTANETTHVVSALLSLSSEGDAEAGHMAARFLALVGLPT